MQVYGTVNIVASRCSEPACDCLESFVSEACMLHCLRWLSMCGWWVRFARRQYVDFCSREWNIFRWLRPTEKCVQTRDTNSWMGIDGVYTWCNTASPVFAEYVLLYFSVISFSLWECFHALWDLVFDYRRRTFDGLRCIAETSALGFLYKTSWKMSRCVRLDCMNCAPTGQINISPESPTEVCLLKWCTVSQTLWHAVTPVDDAACRSFAWPMLTANESITLWLELYAGYRIQHALFLSWVWGETATFGSRLHHPGCWRPKVKYLVDVRSCSETTRCQPVVESTAGDTSRMMIGLAL